jgi:hypothetical protein
MVQRGHRGPLDCISNLSSGWKGCCIGLFARNKQRRVQGFWKRIVIVSYGTYSFIHLTYVLNLSLTLVVFVQCLQEVRARSRVHRLKIWEEEEEWHKTKTEVELLGTYQKSYVLLHRACSLYVLMIVYYVSCSAPNNLLHQYYVATMLASTLESATNSAIASGSSRKAHSWWDRRKRLTIRASLEQ